MIRQHISRLLVLWLSLGVGLMAGGSFPFAQWDFNSSDPTLPDLGVGSWQTLGGVTNSLASGAGSSDPQNTGDRALILAHFPVATNATAIAGIEFSVATTGYRNLTLQFDLRATATACRRARIRYSMDAGGSFRTGPLITITNAGVFWKGLSVEFQAVPASLNSSRLQVRLVAEPGPAGRFEGVAGTYSPSGTWRLDHVVFSGESIEPIPPMIPISPPVITFTNVISHRIHQGEPSVHSFSEISLRPGESLRLSVDVNDTNNRPVMLLPLDNQTPATASWEFPSSASPHSHAEFGYTASEADAGHFYRVGLAVDNGKSFTQWWTIYVPTPNEQELVISEFLANATTEMPEFIELFERGRYPLDLSGWTLGDSAGVRHRFPSGTTLADGTAIVVWGASAPTAAPLHSQFITASFGGLSLNNGGDQIQLRNAHSNLIERIVYRGADLTNASSLVRTTLPDGSFRAHRSLSSEAWSPGRPTGVGDWFEAARPTRIRLSKSGNSPDQLELQWDPLDGRPARVLKAMDLMGPFQEIARDLPEGSFTDRLTESGAFYRVEWQ